MLIAGGATSSKQEWNFPTSIQSTKYISVVKVFMPYIYIGMQFYKKVFHGGTTFVSNFCRIPPRKVSHSSQWRQRGSGIRITLSRLSHSTAEGGNPLRCPREITAAEEEEISLHAQGSECVVLCNAARPPTIARS